MNGPLPVPQKLEAADLPAYLRWDWDKLANVNAVTFRCQCSPEVCQHRSAEIRGGKMVVVCLRCETIIELRASRIVEDKGVEG